MPVLATSTAVNAVNILDKPIRSTTPFFFPFWIMYYGWECYCGRLATAATAHTIAYVGDVIIGKCNPQ